MVNIFSDIFQALLVQATHKNLKKKISFKLILFVTYLLMYFLDHRQDDDDDDTGRKSSPVVSDTEGGTTTDTETVLSTKTKSKLLRVRVMVFNATFNNISVIS